MLYLDPGLAIWVIDLGQGLDADTGMDTLGGFPDDADLVIGILFLGFGHGNGFRAFNLPQSRIAYQGGQSRPSSVLRFWSKAPRKA